MTASRFLEPIDVVYQRGNKLFGDAGSYGESLALPWPSVIAGAIRSHMLAVEGVDIARFARGDAPHPQLGTPAQPGTFQLTELCLARRTGSQVERLRPLPADMVVRQVDRSDHVTLLQPARLAPALQSSAPLPLLAALRSDSPAKPSTDRWVTDKGWSRYLAGQAPQAGDLVTSAELWKIDERIGIGLDAHSRRADDGQLFSMQAIAFNPGVGYFASVTGATPAKVGVLRLGGDGRAARIHACEPAPVTTDFTRIVRTRRARLVLTTPGLFAAGWLPTGTGPDHQFELGGVRSRVVGAAIARHATVSGWDLATRQPKPARRVAPAGTVYWLDELEATPEALGELSARGLWAEPGDDPQRRAEGFNRFHWAAWE